MYASGAVKNLQFLRSLKWIRFERKWYNQPLIITTLLIKYSGLNMSNSDITMLTGCEESGLTSPYLSTLKIPSAEGDIFVISDLHLAAGLEDDSKYSGTENFFYDESFSRFIQHIKRKYRNNWLVINGDFIDFLRITNIPEKQEDFELWQDYLNKIGINKSLQDLKDSIVPKELEYGLKTHEYKSVWKLICAGKGHYLFFEALAEWLASGNKLVIVKGNHDLELYWKGIRNTIRLMMAEKITKLSGKGTDEVCEEFVFPNLFFTDHSVTFNDSVYIEHGCIYDKFSHVQGEPLLPGNEEINIPFGSFFNRYLLNNLEMVYPFLDNVRPRNKILPLLVRDHLDLGIKVFFRHIPFLIKLIPKGYFFYMFGKLLAFAVPLLILIIWAGISVWIAIRSGTIHIPELNNWVITPLKAVSWGILSYFFVKIVAYFQLAEPEHLNEDAKKIMNIHPEYNFVILGHTHNPEQFEYNGSWYYNTGTWIPIIEISNSEIRWDKTFAFIHLAKDDSGVFLPSALQRWNDDRTGFDQIVLIKKKK
jgi:UDP-2,3-diacylglucosamine pyrophosphatase LpxH